MITKDNSMMLYVFLDTIKILFTENACVTKHSLYALFFCITIVLSAGCREDVSVTKPTALSSTNRVGVYRASDIRFLLESVEMYEEDRALLRRDVVEGALLIGGDAPEVIYEYLNEAYDHVVEDVITLRNHCLKGIPEGQVGVIH